MWTIVIAPESIGPWPMLKRVRMALVSGTSRWAPSLPICVSSKSIDLTISGSSAFLPVNPNFAP